MKTFLFFAALTFGGTMGFSQINEYMPGNNEMQILTTSKTPEGYTGSPYVEKDFTQGVIIDEDGKTQPAFLRYNTVEDVVEIKMKHNDKDTFVLPKVKNLTYSLNGYTYILDSFRSSEGEKMEGYFVHYFDGDKVDLYGRPLPEVTEAQKAKTGYGKDKPARLGVKMEYFLAVNNGELQQVRLKEKDFMKALPESKAIDNYLSDNKVKSLEDFKKMLEWYENQS